MTIDECETWLEETDAALAPLLVAARPGELVGPVVSPDGALLAEVRTKTPADATDPAVRARAAATIAEQAASRVVNDTVVWHEHL